MHLNHAYPARRLPDGSFEIDGLDIFETCARRNPHTGAVDLFDVGWLQSAAERANAREAAGYLAPVHLGHHGPHGAAPPFAGFLRNLRVELRPDKPRETPAGRDAAQGEAFANPAADATPQPRPAAVLRATLTGIPAEVFARISARRLPYRSVEIHDPAEPEISSLALLDSVVPFFKFPITNVALHDQSNETSDGNDNHDADDETTELVGAAVANDDDHDDSDHLDSTRFAEHEGRLHALARFQALPWETSSAEATDGNTSATTTAKADGERERESSAQRADAAEQVTSLLAQAEQAVQKVVHAVGAAPAESAQAASGEAAGQDSSSTQDEQVAQELQALAAEGFVFAEEAVQRLVAHSTNPRAVFAALRRVLPRAPVATSVGSADADDAADATTANEYDNTVEQLLRELGRSHDATARRVAREAAVEYAANAERFRSIGCTFSEADYIRAKLVPVTFA